MVSVVWFVVLIDGFAVIDCVVEALFWRVVHNMSVVILCCVFVFCVLCFVLLV